VRSISAGSAYRTAARVALAVGLLALALSAWEVATARTGAAGAQAAASAAQDDAAVAQQITALQLAELNDVIQPTATSQKQLLSLGEQTRASVVALAARIDSVAPATAARLRIEAKLLDTELGKLVAATSASNGQAVVDGNARVQRLAASMRSEVEQQGQVDAREAHANLESLRSSQPIVIALLIAALALAAAAALTFWPRDPSAQQARRSIPG